MRDIWFAAITTRQRFLRLPPPASKALESLRNRHHPELLRVDLALHSAQLDLLCNHGYNALMPAQGMRGAG